MARLQDILLQAALLFSQRGYHATSMRELAQAVHLQGGSLYNHIESKEELLRRIVLEAADQFDAALEPIALSKAPPPQRLREALRAHLGVVARNRAWAKVFFDEWKHLSPSHYEEILERRRKVERIYQDLLREGVQQGWFHSDLDLSLATILLLSAANWTYQWFQPEGRLSAEEVADTFADLLLHGFLNNEERASS